MSLNFYYQCNKIIQSPVELENKKLHSIRFKKKFPEVKIGKIRDLFQKYSVHIIPLENSEVFIDYNSCKIKITHCGLLKINGMDKEKVLENAKYFEKVMAENKKETKQIDLRDLIY